MRRREFITLLGGAAAVWPIVAHAQQGRKRIGFLGTSSLSLERHLLDAFVQSLRELGHIDGEKIVIEYRWAEGQDTLLPNLAADRVRLGPEVPLARGTPSAVQANRAA